MPRLRAALCLLPLATCTSLAAPRVWTDIDGRTLEAELVRLDGSDVVIRRAADGREFTLPRARLSAADIAFLDQPPVGEPSPKPAWIDPLDDALGLPLFSDGELWDDDAAGLAKTLRLKAESITPGFESWRRYPRPPLTVLGVPAYMLALRTEDGRIAEFSILFTNSGDYPGFQRDEDRSIIPKETIAAFQSAIAADFETLRGRLAALLPAADTPPGAAQRLAYPGRLERYVAGPHQFLLHLREDRLLALRIQPLDPAATARISDDRLRQRLKSLVTRRDSGDVVLDRIPMVDQGPKGYCVPATFERMLRYSGISADMYDLAALGESDLGGGTYVPRLVEGLERTVRQAGRRLEKLSIKPSPATLARYIDEGRPVLWTLSSTREFNALANDYTARRSALGGDPKAIAALAASVRRDAAALRPDDESGHVCLITGYNRAAGELAFSDSWGPRFAERWLPAEGLQAVAKGEFWVLNF